MVCYGSTDTCTFGMENVLVALFAAQGKSMAAGIMRGFFTE